MTPSLEECTRLHRAVAKYRVVVSRAGCKNTPVDDDLNFAQAQAFAQTWTEKLAADEPHLAGRMGRSLALVELTNQAAVAKILGYGTSFSYERAVAAVQGLQQGTQAPAA